MLHVAFLLLAQAAAGEAPVLKGVLKEIPAEGKLDPAFQLDATTNLPNGALVDVSLYYDEVDEGRELAKGTATVKDGKLSQDLLAFPGSKKNLAGKYVARLRYNPALQNLNIPGFADGRSDTQLVTGDAALVQAETKAVRARLAADLQAMSALGDEVKAQIEAKKLKTFEEWKPLLKEWGQKAVDIQARANPIKVREFRVLKLDLIADSGLENLTGILNSAARHAAGGQSVDALEGLTRLRQNAEYLTGEVNSTRLTTPSQMLLMVESARGVIKDAISQSDPAVLFMRRRFVESNLILQKSVPEELQPILLDIGSRAAAFFNALADKESNVKELYAELDKALEKLAGTLRTLK